MVRGNVPVMRRLNSGTPSRSSTMSARSRRSPPVSATMPPIARTISPCGAASRACGCRRRRRARVAASLAAGSSTPMTPRALHTMAQRPMAVSNRVKDGGVMTEVGCSIRCALCAFTKVGWVAQLRNRTQGYCGYVSYMIHICLDA